MVAVWLANLVIVFAIIAGVALLFCTTARADCPPPLRLPVDGDTCTATIESPTRQEVERVPVLVVRHKQLDSADLLSWSVPGAVVVVKDGMRRGQTTALPLSVLSECRP